MVQGVQIHSSQAKDAQAQILTEFSKPFQLEGLFGQADAGAFGGGAGAAEGADAEMEDDPDAFVPDAESMDEDG